jgi:putative ABC transport system permease protein
VMSFAVARRRREIGIRLAIGARPREILVMIAKQGVCLALMGIAVGVLASIGATRFLNPMAFVLVPFFLLPVALLACILPARVGRDLIR